MIKRPFITLKVFNHKGKLIEKVGTRKIRRIYHFLQAEKFKDRLFKLSVRYGGDFKNEGDYKARKDLICAFKAFMDTNFVKEFMEEN